MRSFLSKPLVNLADVKSLACYPASPVHRQVSAEEPHAAGVTPEMIRLNIGTQRGEVIIADLNEALEAAVATRVS
jgi:O-acetylhomoserine (thiol)-lyase